PATGEVDFFADLRLYIPAAALERRRDELRADVALRESALIHFASGRFGGSYAIANWLTLETCLVEALRRARTSQAACSFKRRGPLCLPDTGPLRAMRRRFAASS